MAARRYGRRLRRGAAGTAVAAAAMAALSASQAPGFLPAAHASTGRHDSSTVTPPPGPAIDGGSPYITDLPPLNTPTGPPLVEPSTPGADSTVTVPGGGAKLPATVLAAYRRAETSVAESNPGCHLPWQLLAAIGQVESGQARGGAVDANGTTFTPILGPVLDGNGFANISDTDSGRFDGDALHDRAVGPMQFIPSTWEHWGADGNGDGADDPNNVYDAALAAAHYLCADGRDLSVPQDMDRAILGYNHSQAYLNLVRAWFDHFMSGGAVSVPDRSGTPGATVTPGSPAGSPSAPGTPPGTRPAPSVSMPPAAPGTPPSGPSKPGTPPGSGQPSSPPTGPTTTPPPSTTPPPTTPPPPTGTPTTPPTTPTCTEPPTPTPSDTTTPTPTPTPSGTPTDDPCATPTPSGSPTPTPTPSESGSATTAP